MDIQPVQAPRGCRITEVFKGWANQGGATVALIQKLHRRGEDQTIGGDALTQSGDLAGNRVGFCLVI
jgi:hypothetical protein